MADKLTGFSEFRKAQCWMDALLPHVRDQVEATIAGAWNAGAAARESELRDEMECGHFVINKDAAGSCMFCSSITWHQHEIAKLTNEIKQLRTENESLKRRLEGCRELAGEVIVIGDCLMTTNAIRSRDLKRIGHRMLAALEGE